MGLNQWQITVKMVVIESVTHIAGYFDILRNGIREMNPGPVSTPTPTNCLRLMQRNTNGISGKIT